VCNDSIQLLVCRVHALCTGEHAASTRINDRSGSLGHAAATDAEFLARDSI